MRQAKIDAPLSRKVAVRSIGDNTRDEVEAYIEKQVVKEEFVDPRFEEELTQFTVCYPVDLSQPTPPAHGRYWYNLHVVLVVADRGRIRDPDRLALIRDSCLRIAEWKGYAPSRISVMPDHVHLAIRGAIDRSPAEIVGAFQYNLAYIMGNVRVWQDSFYVGTFSEYNTNAIRVHMQDGP